MTRMEKILALNHVFFHKDQSDLEGMSNKFMPFGRMTQEKLIIFASKKDIDKNDKREGLKRFLPSLQG